jgi:hypothetical protein
MTPERRAIGRYRGVNIDLAAWDGVAAAVDLSVVCMFTHEVPGKAMTGGLQHLDRTLDGRLSRLRQTGVFAAEQMETWLIDRVPPGIAADAILVIGLGDPLEWTPSATTRAVARALEVAQHRQATSVAFAPSLLDAGLDDTEGAAPAMLEGLCGALRRATGLAGSGLSNIPRLQAWTFDAGAAHMDGAASAFQKTFSVFCSGVH